VIGHLLNETAVQRRRAASVSDGMGGETGGGTTTLGDLAVRVSMTSDDEQERADRETGVVVSNVYAASSADLRRGDLLDVRGTTLEVLVVSRPSVASAYVRAQAKETQAAPV
jgi:hypothetical protein